MPEIRAPHSSSSRSTYRRVFFGRSSKERQPVMSSVQPSRYSYTGVAWWKSDWLTGSVSCRSPFTSYATQTGICSQPVSTSSLVRKMSVNAFACDAASTTSASNQPQRRLRPVVVPNSAPISRSFSPSASNSSVGIGPSPTRVVYALAMPITRSIRVGPTPAPTQAPPAIGLEEVTYGYVPWSTSR